MKKEEIGEPKEIYFYIKWKKILERIKKACSDKTFREEVSSSEGYADRHRLEDLYIYIGQELEEDGLGEEDDDQEVNILVTDRRSGFYNDWYGSLYDDDNYDGSLDDEPGDEGEELYQVFLMYDGVEDTIIFGIKDPESNDERGCNHLRIRCEIREKHLDIEEYLKKKFSEGEIKKQMFDQANKFLEAVNTLYKKQTEANRRKIEQEGTTKREDLIRAILGEMQIEQLGSLEGEER